MYLVVGASGYLGAYVIKNIVEKTTDTVIALARQADLWEDEQRVRWMLCDIADFDSIEKAAGQLSGYEHIKIVYLAAYHLPDQVKKNPHIAWNMNITSLAHFINCSWNAACFYYISTEMVYGEGGSRLFREQDALHPVNLYGKQKAVAESIVLGYGYQVLRMPFLIGPSILKKKKHFYDEIVEDIKSDKPVRMFADAYKNALDFDTAAGVIVDCCERHEQMMPPVMNVCGDEALSKYEIGKRIAKANGCEENLIVPMNMQESNTVFQEKRAGSTLMDNTLLKQFLKISQLKINLANGMLHEDNKRYL